MGCKLNFAETSDLLRRLAAEGNEIVDFSEVADMYIVNTCTVTAVAEKKCRNAIRQAVAQNPNAEVVVIGCMAETARNEIAAIPGVTAVYGNERIAPRVEDVPDGWQWYAFKPKKIHDNQEFYFASGRFSKGGGRAAVNGVRIDRVEISRVTSP